MPITPDSLKACLKTFVEAGLPAATFDASLGGMQLPMLVANFMQGIFQAANGSAVGYIFLTTSNAHMLEACGSDALRARYLPRLSRGVGLAPCVCLNLTPDRHFLIFAAWPSRLVMAVSS